MPHHEFLDILHQEHEKVKSTLEQLTMSAGGGSQRQQLFNMLKQDLTPHLIGEEKYFYPALQQKPDAKMDALEAIEEHHAAELFLDELDKTPIQEDRWTAKCMVLKDLVEHHVQEEESKVFEKARKDLSEDQMQDIMQNFQKEKSRTRRY